MTTGMASVWQLLGQPVVQQLLHIHPNDAAATDFRAPEEWTWWEDPPDWQNLAEDPELKCFLGQIGELELPRDAIALDRLVGQSAHGMSPKKHHEVTRMSDYIGRLLPARFPALDPASVRIVDIGAGQGYVTRALHSHFRAYTLALDSDHAQTTGAQSRAANAVTHDITHRTLHITEHTLLRAIDDWIPSTLGDTDTNAAPVPVLFIALHACGSLTPDILRAFLRAHAAPPPLWTPLALVAVGCCYNLLHPHDFPLAPLPSPPPPLPPAAYHLAAQVPAHWPANPAAAALSLRKVVWRALLARLYADLHPAHPPTSTRPGTGSTPTMQRLGRLRDAAYLAWPAFLATAGTKVGVDFVAAAANSDTQGRHPLLERRLEVLHVLRCSLGPLIESLIILDRIAWFRTALEDAEPNNKGSPERIEVTPQHHMQIEAINLFDQATGSARNIALVVAPAPPSQK
ncbi:methyltransferase domain-containing protein [Collybia nuda]|uniref:Methyltransferase domain-containing protein n=1 Tax=Collybia nuda TaxID=64659 RepID=A0A9P6CJM3_9AGAR|nr:methyltransferase domain-containing protein [Collybia nuda]